MRVGIHSEESYPLHNCTHDTLKVLMKSSDPDIVKLAKFIEAKKRRPRFDVWVIAHEKREDDVGVFVRWLMVQQSEGRFFIRFSGPPDTLLNYFINSRWHGVDFPEEAEKGLAQALEEWDRWGT